MSVSRAAVLAAVAAVLGAGALVARDPDSPPPSSGRAESGEARRLSNERTRSRWAYVRSTTLARRGPARGARLVARVERTSAVDTPEVVLALSELRDADGRLWTRIRLPARSASRTGWVPRHDLGAYHIVTTAMRIDLRTLTATLDDGGRQVWRAPIATGSATDPTPTGRFYVRSRIVPVEDGLARPDGFYGAFAFGTSAYAPNLSDWPGGGIVAIHGTNRPALIPGRVSRGCVRLSNTRIARLRKLMPLGTPVEVVG